MGPSPICSSTTATASGSGGTWGLMSNVAPMLATTAVLAPPEISDEARDAWIEALETMHASAGWKQALEDNGWTDAFITGDEFATFMADQDKRVVDTLTALGLV